MNKKERYDIRRFGARLGVFLMLVSAIIGFSVICLYKAGGGASGGAGFGVVKDYAGEAFCRQS